MKPLGADEYRILVVEDQQRYRELLVREIHEMGFPAHGAESGEAAWECLQKAEFHTVLLDLNLPGMSGMDLFAKIRDADHPVSVVILTAYGEMDSAVQALRWNADDYLSKPCSLGQIECILVRLHQEWVERQRTEQEPEQIEEEQLPQLIPAPQSPDQADATTLEKLEREHILKALAANGGNKPATAEQLGVSLRTLYNRLEKYKYS